MSVAVWPKIFTICPFIYKKVCQPESRTADFRERRYFLGTSEAEFLHIKSLSLEDVSLSKKDEDVS